MMILLIPLMAVLSTTGQKVSDINVTLDAQMVALLGGVVVPLLVGVLTKSHASDGVKAVVNALLSALAGVIATFTQDGLFHASLKTLVITILSAWGTSIISYYGLFKPTGVAGTVAAATSNFGIGSPPMLETPDKGAEDPGPAPGQHLREP